MYIREKRNGGSSYYQVVESSRVEGKPRQRVILHLGVHSTLKEARTELKRELSKARSEMQRISNFRGARSGGKEAARVEKRIAKLSEKLSKVEKLLKASSCSA